MKYARSEGAIDMGVAKYILKMPDAAGATGGDQWHGAERACRLQLRQIESLSNPVMAHAVKYDLTSAAGNRLLYP